MLKTFLSIRFFGDLRNKGEIVAICELLDELHIESFCFLKDAEEWLAKSYTPEEMMQISYREIDASDFLLVETSSVGIGLGVEAGYAYAKGIPVVTICRQGNKIPNTLKGISKKTYYYRELRDLRTFLEELKKEIGQKKT